MYDVIVVGAGPGGSTAAAFAARKGLKTLLIDRDAFPRVKACGDAIGINCFTILNELGIHDLDKSYAHPIYHVMIQGPGGKSLTVPLSDTYTNNSAIIERYYFDNILYECAIDSGAEFVLMSASDLVIESGQVVGVYGKVNDIEIEFRAKVIIGADGATSLVARKLDRQKRPDHSQAIAIRGYVMTDLELDGTLEFAYLHDAPGYGWFFPMGSHYANIGIGMRSDSYKAYPQKLAELLHGYANQAPLAEKIGNNTIENIKSWQIPMFLAPQQRVFDGAILIGDAGGFVDPLAGSGIYQAMITGKLAVETAANAIQKNDINRKGLAEYDTTWLRHLQAKMRKTQALHHLFHRFPQAMDSLIDIAKVVPHITPFFTGKL